MVSMTFIQDSGSVFKASLEIVWKLAKDHVEHGNKIHPNTRKNKTEIIDETSFINTWEQDDDNKTGVTVVGNFKSNVIPEEQIKPTDLGLLEKVFSEDVAYLNEIKQKEDH